MNGNLRILVTGFGPFPGAPWNPTQPLVARLTRLRRPAFTDVDFSSHIFPVTYKAVDRELPQLLEKASSTGAADVRPRRAHRACPGRDPRPQCRHHAVAGRRADPLPQGLDRIRPGCHHVRPAHRKTAPRGARHRHRCARLARRRRLSLQLSELARDRGGRGPTTIFASPPSCTSRCSRATAHRCARACRASRWKSWSMPAKRCCWRW